MTPRPPRSTRPDTLFPYTTHFLACYHRGSLPFCSLIATGDSLINTCPPAPEVGQIPLDRRARDLPEIVRTRDIALQRAAKTDYAGKADPGHPGSFRHADTGVCGVKTLRGCPDRKSTRLNSSH